MADVNSTTRNEFTLFPTLPTELQLKIWSFAVPGPRIVSNFLPFSALRVKVKLTPMIWRLRSKSSLPIPSIYDPDYEPDYNPTEGQLRYDLGYPSQRVEMRKLNRHNFLSTDTTNPGLIFADFACHNSRSVALKHYTGALELPGSKKLLFHSTNDTIFIFHATPHHLYILPGIVGQPTTHPNYSQIFADVKRLAVNVCEFYEQDDAEMVWLLSHFKSLKTLLLLVNSHRKLQSLAQSTEELWFCSGEEL